MSHAAARAEAGTEGFVRAGGITLRAVRDAGAGRSVLVLHGFTGSAESMQGVARDLAGRREVVRLELVGHGGSDAPRELAAYAMPACAGQIVDAVAGLGLERPHLLGYSMGGRAALAAAIAAPEAFSSLVLVGATAGIADPIARAERVVADEALAARIEREGIEAFVDAWMALPLFASQARLGPEALARSRRDRLRQRPQGLANSLRGMGAGAQPPLHDRLDRIAVPVLLVVGEEDAKFRGIAEELRRLLADARIAILPDAGHAAHLEAPAAFAACVSHFLDDVDAGREERS
ncbi:MAG: 2-succinyl-6-hydroxy-2,4-cyclohexadiene-1-carboxylate synthase [Spirochaetaceae bacterium]|nr:2-succinyl-6-hydroxy-2,4-cyclohexadiene-1-carboxylate synthase [Myxococcales bacterium]MCB9724828.1 2-succinyl-6-hydroxy-2,4-cyclohexadiene-1-carboxylate synthase [Spirochaetaceae bacterium]HPG24072.1 2-succinyl-6-hydroxy-2,4-cyclohexadiene-1-carboxylate synthase [Myxococcota bacterium]